MKIVIEGYEGIDFPFMLPSKRRFFEQNLKASIRRKLELREKDIIELHQHYRNYDGDELRNDNKYKEVIA